MRSGGDPRRPEPHPKKSSDDEKSSPRANGHASSFGDLVFDPKSPLITARRFIKDRYTAAGQRLLHRQAGQIYSYAGTHYRLAEDDQITSDLYHYLEKAKRPGAKGALVDYHPNRSKVADALGALLAVSHLPDTRKPPCWLTDAPPDLPADEIIACANGLLHLPSLSFLPHTPDLFITNALDIAYDRGAAPAVKWLKFLGELWGEDPLSIDTLQETFGYCLGADTTQEKAFMVVGPKRSGKGTIGRVLRALVGPDNVAGPTLASLSDQFGIEPLIGKRLAMVSDARLGARSDAATIAERILSITGEDGLTVARKFMSAWHGQLTCRFVILSNELPRLSDASGALVSRFIVLVLKQSFYGREDPGLTAALLHELPGILNWAIEGYRRLHERGHFVQPESAREAIQDLEDLGSPIGAYLRDCCIVDAGRTVGCARLFASWQAWCEAQGRGSVGTVQTFGRDLRAAVPGISIHKPIEGETQVRHYEGIGLT